MKPLQFSEDFLPLCEFKARASRILRKLRKSQRPVVITQNGRPAAVLISPEDFDAICERERFIAAVQEGWADSEAGRAFDAEEVRRLLDEEFGP